MFAKGLQLIPVSDDEVVLKRGVAELLLKGPGIHTLVEPLIRLLGDSRGREDIVEAFPGHLRSEVHALLQDLLDRRLITEQPPATSSDGGAEALQASFWRSFGDVGEVAFSRLGDATVLVVGANEVSRAVVRSLLTMKLGRVALASHPILDNVLIPWANGNQSAREKRVEELHREPRDEDFEGCQLVCAACDFGSPDALLEMSRQALRSRKPFLPVWLSNMVGYVGPVTYPFETACLRCYHVRTDSNNRGFEAARAVRRFVASDPDARYAGGFLPPMAGVIGQIAGMEIVKFLGGLVPADTIGRVIEVNLVSFASSVRRVLKVPRCPDCSEVMQRSSRTVTVLPQIPFD
jgi:bacteriocin biosynthesis cyclodehydratase domain-containing protein